MSHHLYRLPNGATVVEQWKLGRLVVLEADPGRKYPRGLTLAQAPQWRRGGFEPIEQVCLWATPGTGDGFFIPSGTRWFNLRTRRHRRAGEEDLYLGLNFWVYVSYPLEHQPAQIVVDQTANRS